MVMEQETAQTLEAVPGEGLASLGQEEVSEESTTTDLEVAQEVQPSEDNESVIQAEVDKRSNSYREKREADTALIRSLQTQLKELNTEKNTRRLNQMAEEILAGDEEEGLEVDKIERRNKNLKEINATIKDYNEKSAVVEETAALASAVSEKVGKKIADKFDLLDSNPATRAKGVSVLIGDAVHFLEREEAFGKILEEVPLLQKGSEVRKQIDSFVERYLELSDEKGRDLLIKQLKQEFRVNPTKKPPTPSDIPGGIDLDNLTPRELIRHGLKTGK